MLTMLRIRLTKTKTTLVLMWRYSSCPHWNEQPSKEFLLHVVCDTCAQLHGGGESKASGCRGRHVRLQNCFQGVQDIVLWHLINKHVHLVKIWPEHFLTSTAILLAFDKQAEILHLPVQVRFPGTLLWAAGPRILLYTSTPPGPEIAVRMKAAFRTT